MAILSVLSILAIIVSICALWGCIEKTMDLQRQVDELKAGFWSTDAMPQRFDKSFFEKGEDRVLSGSPPEDTIVINGEELRKRFTKKRVTENTTTTETRNV